jgi:hypothetical protein
MARTSSLRASDADREAIAERLRRAAIEGRLEPDELEERLHRALRARTYGDLGRLVADLPLPARRRRRRTATPLALTGFAIALRVAVALVAVTVVVAAVGALLVAFAAVLALATAWWFVVVIAWVAWRGRRGPWWARPRRIQPRTRAL